MARNAKNYLLTYSAAKAEKASLLSPRGGCWAGPHSSTTGSSCLPEVLYPSLGSPSTTASMSCEVEVEQAATWFAEQLFEPNEQRQIFHDCLKVRARPSSVRVGQFYALGRC